MKLYVYDHCPYCVKARMIFGFKNVDYELIYLLNDDEKTPISMVGQKMLPILEINQDQFMPESLDIIDYVDKQDKNKIISKKTNSQWSSWMSRNSSLCYELAVPRWINASLEEFKTKGARDYFTKKKEAYIGPFKNCLDNTDFLISQMEEELDKLSALMSSDASFINGSLSLDDIHLFAFLRSLSIVKDLNFPNSVKKYMEDISKKSKVPLHADIAI